MTQNVLKIALIKEVMCERIDPLDLAKSKAIKENKIIIYEVLGNNYDIPSSYANFYYYEFDKIENFCEALYETCMEIYGYSNLPYEFQCIHNDEFFITIDDYRSVYITNFPDSIDISKHEDQILEYFEKMTTRA